MGTTTDTTVQQTAGSKANNKFWIDAVNSLELYIKKQVANRRAWGTFSKVVPPSAPQRPYSVILERGGVTEQFFLREQEVFRFATTGTELYVANEIRAALHHLDKRTKGKSSTQAWM